MKRYETRNYGVGSCEVQEVGPVTPAIEYRYGEGRTISKLRGVIDATYGQHYAAEDIQCFDAWVACGGASDTCRNTAIKYLWRFGKKNGRNTDDLYKAMHFIVLMLHAEDGKTKGEA